MKLETLEAYSLVYSYIKKNSAFFYFLKKGIQGNTIKDICTNYPSFRLYQSKQIIFSGVVMTSVSQFGLVIGDMLN